MLSILIPIYNENVVELVSSLQDQCDKLDLIYEIVCIDDCSTERIHVQNKVGLSNNRISYHRLHKNVGRARIRNKLIANSQYNWLLFVDADHKVVSESYISTYLIHLDTISETLIYGGTAYPEKLKVKNVNLLHWYYGSSREAIPAKRRRLSPANHVHTNNLLLRKDHLGDIRFDESILGYGYEDILFSQAIYKAGKTIKHIDNPLTHLGLKSHKDFIIDLKASSLNLATLYTDGKIEDLKSIRVFEVLRSALLLTPLIFVLRNCEHLCIKMLKIKPQLLYLVDTLRLLYFAQSTQSHHKYQNKN